MSFPAIVSGRVQRLLASATAATALAMLTPVVASAQTGDDRDRVVTIGLGPQIGPSYLGADGHRVYPLPFANIRRPGQPMPFSAADDSPSIRLIRTERFSIGPTLNFRAKRRESDVGAAVGNVKVGIEPGLFIEAYPVDTVRLRAEGRLGINGHDGFVADVAADYIMRSPDQRLVLGFGPRLRLGNGEFEGRYFGVDTATSARTGLPSFAPDGGVYAVGVQAAGHYDFGGGWGVYGTAGYDRLTGAGNESPIVREFGSRSQFYGGVAATYSFNLRL